MRANDGVVGMRAVPTPKAARLTIISVVERPTRSIKTPPNGIVTTTVL